MKPSPWPPRPRADTSSSSSDDSLFAAAAAASSSTSGPSADPVFPRSSLNSLPTTPPSSAAASAANSFFANSSSFLSSSSSSDDSPALFAPSSSLRPPRPAAKPKTVVGTKTSFILGGKLGQGAYATVKEGIDEQSLRIVAVKILDLRRLRKLRGGLDAIEREVAVQKRLKRHPNLIELIDVVRAPAKAKMYIVLEMANGCTVQELADAAPRHRLPESQVANFAFQTLKGLQYMHGKGVVHRDIKPSNMMLTAAGGLKISDFGVAEFLNEYNLDDQVSRTSGSPAFQAPEIATGASGYSGMKVDVWALGVTVYLLLTGNIPFEADNLLVLFDLIGKGHYVEPEWMNESCRSLIRGMLRVDWEKRDCVDDLLKHPWIVRGGVELSEQQRIKRGWVSIPRKDFGILDVVKRMYNTEPEFSNAMQSPSLATPGKLGSSRDASESVRWQPWPIPSNDDQETGPACTIA